MNQARRGVYTIVGDPIPLFRAKPNYHQRIMWDSQRDLRAYWKCLLEKMHGRKPLYAGPLRLEVLCFIEIPHSRKNRDLLINNFHISPPDASNCLKWVEDACEKVLFSNDCTIADSRCIKIWCTKPRTIFIITELEYQSKVNLEEFGL